MEKFSLISVDSFIIIAILISMIIGIIRGAVKETLTIISWGGAIFLTIYIFPYGKDIAKEYIKHGLIADFVTACILFVVFLAILSIFNYICSNIVKNSIFSGADRFLGAIFGIIRGIFILTIIDVMANQWLLVDSSPSWINESKLRPYIAQVTNYIILILPESAQNSVLSHMSQMNKDNIIKFLYNENPTLNNKLGELLKAEDIPPSSTIEEDDEIEENDTIEEITQDAKKLATLTPKPPSEYNSSNLEPVIKNRSEKEQLDMKRIIDQELLENYEEE